MFKWTAGKIAIIFLSALAGLVCAYRGEDLEQAGIITRHQASLGAVILIILAVSYLLIMYEVNKQKRGK